MDSSPSFCIRFLEQVDAYVIWSPDNLLSIDIATVHVSVFTLIPRCLFGSYFSNKATNDIVFGLITIFHPSILLLFMFLCFCKFLAVLPDMVSFLGQVDIKGSSFSLLIIFHPSILLLFMFLCMWNPCCLFRSDFFSWASWHKWFRLWSHNNLPSIDIGTVNVSVFPLFLTDFPDLISWAGQHEWYGFRSQ